MGLNAAADGTDRERARPDDQSDRPDGPDGADLSERSAEPEQSGGSDELNRSDLSVRSDRFDRLDPLDRGGFADAAAESVPMRVIVSGDGTATIDGVPVPVIAGETVEEAVLDTLHGYAVSRNEPVRAVISDPSSSHQAVVDVAPDGSSSLVEHQPQDAAPTEPIPPTPAASGRDAETEADAATAAVPLADPGIGTGTVPAPGPTPAQAPTPEPGPGAGPDPEPGFAPRAGLASAPGLASASEPGSGAGPDPELGSVPVAGLVSASGPGAGAGPTPEPQSPSASGQAPAAAPGAGPASGPGLASAPGAGLRPGPGRGPGSGPASASASGPVSGPGAAFVSASALGAGRAGGGAAAFHQEGVSQTRQRGRGSDQEYERPGLLRRLPLPGLVGVGVAFAVVVPLMLLGGHPGHGGDSRAGGTAETSSTPTAAPTTEEALPALTGSPSARTTPTSPRPSPSRSTATAKARATADANAAPTAGGGAGGTLLYASEFGAGAHGWKDYGGHWSVAGGAYTESMAGTGGNKAVIGDTGWRDYVLQGDVRVGHFSPNGNAGLLVRASDPATGTDSLDGYYVGVSGSSLIIGREKYGWKELAGTAIPGGLSADTWYHLTVRVVGCSIAVDGTPAADPSAAPVSAAVQDCTFLRGAIGVRDFAAAASWRDLTVRTADTV